jgi:hypothetical protein
VSVAEVVQHDDELTFRPERFYRNAADVPCASRYQHTHVPTALQDRMRFESISLNTRRKIWYSKMCIAIEI